MRARDHAVAMTVLAFAAGIVLFAAACGGGGSSSSTGASAANRQPYLAYSRCMRAHGAPFWPEPDATVTSGAPAYKITPRILAQEHGPPWNAALSACAKKAPSQLPFTEAGLEAAAATLMKVTRCMRAHGFPGWPDPEIGPDDIGFLPPRGADPANPKFKAAQQACHMQSAP